MVHRAQFSLCLAAAALVICWANPQPAAADGPGQLFANYYVPAGSPAGVAAQMYPCPRPTPPLVGHTYVTYQPLAPQQFLYQHCDYYRTVNCDCSVTRTKVSYNHRCLCLLPQPSVMWGVSTPCMPPVKATFRVLHAVGRGTSPTRRQKEAVAMKRSRILLVVSIAAVALAAGQAWAFEFGPGPGSNAPWHGYYYDAAWGMPVALVMPPTVHQQTDYSWGVSSARRSYIYAQFRQGWPGPGIYDRNAFRPTPPGPATRRSSACTMSAGRGRGDVRD